MTPREYKALLELKRWIIAAISNHKEAVRLIEALEPLCRGIHTGDKGEVSALRLDEINETEEALRERLKNMLNVSASPTAGRYRAKGAIHNNFEKILSDGEIGTLEPFEGELWTLKNSAGRSRCEPAQMFAEWINTGILTAVEV